MILSVKKRGAAHRPLWQRWPNGKVHIMQKSSKFYFSFIYIPFDRAWKVGHKYIIFKSTGPCFTGKKIKRLWKCEKWLKTAKKWVFVRNFQVFCYLYFSNFLKGLFSNSALKSELKNIICMNFKWKSCLRWVRQRRLPEHVFVVYMDNFVNLSSFLY